MSRTDRAADPARWFLRRGLTNLLEGTPVHRGASTRAATALVVLVVLSLLVWVPGFSDNLLVSLAIAGAELWQSFGRLDSWAFLAPVLLFVALSVGFLVQREHLDIEALSRFETEDEWRAALSPNPIGTPATHGAGAASGIPAGVRPPRFPAACPLDARQRANLRLVATLSRLVVAGLVGLAVFLVFLVLGLFVVDPALVKAWGGADADIIWQWASSRRTYAVTWENIRVSGFLALFSAFYYAIVSATDASLRQGLADTANDTVREACARRLALLDAPRPGRR